MCSRSFMPARLRRASVMRQLATWSIDRDARIVRLQDSIMAIIPRQMKHGVYSRSPALGASHTCGTC